MDEQKAKCVHLITNMCVNIQYVAMLSTSTIIDIIATANGTITATIW